MTIRVAAAQMRVLDGDLEHNLRAAKSMMQLAGEQEADIIGFPEFFLSGTSTVDLTKHGDTIPGRFTEEFAPLCREYGMHLVMGSIYELADGGAYNSSALLDDRGELIGVYRKNKLWLGEEKRVTPAYSRPVFKTRLGTIGIMICWDLAFPEIARSLAKNGADLIYNPVHWSVNDYTRPPYPKDVLQSRSNYSLEQLLVNTLAPARAVENGVAMVLINGTGKYESAIGPKTFIEGSQIALPFYGVTQKATGEQVLIDDIDLELAKIAKAKYRLILDAD